MTSDFLAHIDSSAVLPQGYTQRAATLDDAAEIARLFTAANQERGEDETIVTEQVLRQLQYPFWDITTASQVFFSPHGEMVACVVMWDYNNPTHPWINWDMVSDDHWQDVLRVVIAWAEQRALPALERCQPEERFAPVADCMAETPQQAFLESLGYRIVRHFYRMGMTLHEAPAVQALPAGLTLRTFEYPADLEALALAHDDIWQDHYGYVPRPQSEVINMWRDRIEKNPRFDAAMWYLATDTATGEIAGIVLCDPRDTAKPDQGHINIIGVRRAYRKRGLAQAMMTHAFAEFWRRGQTLVNLGVDASSPTGATRLYERVGMLVMHRYLRLEKELRPGVERMNTGH